MHTRDVIEAHRAAGQRFQAAGVGSFVREAGPATGDPVLCLHGVPASCFLYRKVLRELASRGLLGLAFDLPGLGLADRPETFDYTWTGLGRFCVAAVDVLGLDRFHLVVHDIGGPVGFELAAAMPERVASLTVLDTLVEVDTFKRKWSMEPFARNGIGEAYLRALSKPVFRGLTRLQGVENPKAVPRAEMDAYVDLLRMTDRGHAFLRVMRGFERTRTKRELYVGVLRDKRYPVQIVWGSKDPALKLAVEGEAARRGAGVDKITLSRPSTSCRKTSRRQIAHLISRLAAAQTMQQFCDRLSPPTVDLPFSWKGVRLEYQGDAHTPR